MIVSGVSSPENVDQRGFVGPRRVEIFPNSASQARVAAPMLVKFVGV
jgi:hypothetical protein